MTAINIEPLRKLLEDEREKGRQQGVQETLDAIKAELGVDLRGDAQPDGGTTIAPVTSFNENGSDPMPKAEFARNWLRSNVKASHARIANLVEEIQRERDDVTQWDVNGAVKKLVETGVLMKPEPGVVTIAPRH